MIEVKKLLGKRIAEIRKSKKMQQEDLAEIIGIEPNNLSKIETGKNYPNPENLAKMAQVPPCPKSPAQPRATLPAIPQRA